MKMDLVAVIFILIFSFLHLFSFVEKYRKVTDNPWFYVWVSDAVIFSIYAYAWDVRQDFDLWDCKAQVNTKCLRDELIYESKVGKQTLRIHFFFSFTCDIHLFTTYEQICKETYFFIFLCECVVIIEKENKEPHKKLCVK